MEGIHSLNKSAFSEGFAYWSAEFIIRLQNR